MIFKSNIKRTNLQYWLHISCWDLFPLNMNWAKEFIWSSKYFNLNKLIKMLLIKTHTHTHTHYPIFEVNLLFWKETNVDSLKSRNKDLRNLRNIHFREKLCHHLPFFQFLKNLKVITLIGSFFLSYNYFMDNSSVVGIILFSSAVVIF